MARVVALRFGTEEGEASISGELQDFSYYDRDSGWMYAETQIIPATRIPRRGRLKVKWLNLPELISHQTNPVQWPKIQKAVQRTRYAILQEAVYDGFFRDLSQEGHQGQTELQTGDATLTLTVGSATRNAHDGRVIMDDIRVVETWQGGTKTITGHHAVLLVDVLDENDQPVGVLDITGEVTITMGEPPSGETDGSSLSSGGKAGTSIKKGQEILRGIMISPEIIEEIAAIPDTAILSDHFDRPLRPSAAELKVKADLVSASFIRDVTSELHSRLAFSVSAFVVVILGAILGIMYRGAHPQIAFAISFVPALFVIIMNIMGRQLAEKEGTVMLGIGAIWGAILLVGILDAITLTRVVRR